MYTRSYNIQSRKEVKSEPLNTIKEEEKVELPEGYSGTVMLREQEITESHSEEKLAENNEKAQLRGDKPVKFSFTRVPKMPKSCADTKEKAAADRELRQACEGMPSYGGECACREGAFHGHKPCKNQNKGDLDRLLIGALILLLMNEKADDVLTLILGYMLM